MKRSAAFPSYDAMARLAFEDAPIGMAVISPQHRFLHVNRAYCEFTGYSRQELLGMTVRDITYPDDWKGSIELIRRMHAGLDPVRRLEKRYVHKSGRILWGAVRARRIVDSGSGRPYALSQVIDITQKKKAEEALRISEERFRIALTGTDITVYAHDLNLRYTWGYNLTPGFSTKAILGKRPSDVLDARSARQSEAIKRDVIRSGVGRRDEVTCHMPDRTLIYDVSTEPLRDENGRITGVICAAVNITERKRIEKQLQDMQGHLVDKVKVSTSRLRALAEELSRTELSEREKIAHFLHDDVQQLFAGAQYSLSTLKTDYLGAAGRQALDQIRRALDRGLALTRSLSTDLRPPVLDTVEWHPILSWIAEDARKKFGLKVRFKVDGAQPITSPTLRGFAFDAIRELVFNVHKHAGVSEARIQVAAAGRNRVRITVRDQGPGFNPDRKKDSTFGILRITARADAVGGHFEVGRGPTGGAVALLILPLR